MLSTGDIMEIELALTRNDHLVLAQYRTDHSPQMHQRARKLRWSYTVAFLAIALGYYLILPEVFIPLLFAILAIVSLVSYPYIHRWRVRRDVKREVEKRAKPQWFTNRKLRVTADGLEEETEYFEGKVKWSLVDGLDVTPDNTFVSIEGVYSVIIPRSSVKKGDYDEFVARYLAR
jgi:membrane protein implicated in regulation of membrane protease activity